MNGKRPITKPSAFRHLRLPNARTVNVKNELIGKFIGKVGALSFIVIALKIILSWTAQLDGLALSFVGFITFCIIIILLSAIALRWMKTERNKLFCRNILFLVAQLLGFCWMPLVALIALPVNNPWRPYFVAGLVGYIVLKLVQSLPITVFLRSPLRVPFGLSLTPAIILHRNASEPPRLRFAHLSDLHLTADRTLEADLNEADVAHTVSRVLAWALRRADYVFITGDITDQARAAEWRKFLAILDEKKCPLDSGRLFVIPGNHDLSLSADILPGKRNLTHYDHHAFLFIQNILTRCPTNWSMLISNELVGVRAFLAEREAYLKTYETHPPYSIIPGFWKQHEIITPEELLRGTDAHLGTPWPTHDRPTCTDFLEIVFPIVMHNDSEQLVIGLNSNVIAAKNISNSAIGMLGTRQLERLRTIVSSAGTRYVFLLIHHHIGFPPGKLEEFRVKHGMVQTDALTLLDADALGQVVSGIKRCCVLHGHKHFPYYAMYGSAVVISGHSAVYGPYQGETGAIVFQLDYDGKLALTASCDLSYPRDSLKSGRRKKKNVQQGAEMKLAPAIPAIHPITKSATPIKDFYYDRIAPAIGVSGAIVATFAWFDERWHQIMIGMWTYLFYLAGWKLFPPLVPFLQIGLFLTFVSISTRNEISAIYSYRDLWMHVFNIVTIVAMYIFMLPKADDLGVYGDLPNVQALYIAIPIATFIIIFMSSPRCLFKRMLSILLGLIAIAAIKHGIIA